MDNASAKHRSQAIPLAIFERATRPPRSSASALGSTSQWMTWSAEFREVLHSHAAELGKLRPALLTVHGAAPYDQTYHQSPPAALRPAFLAYARRLEGLRPRGDLLLFTGMFDDLIDRRVLHATLALLRAELVEIAGDRRAAFHSPVATTRGRANDFELHADLFTARRLWLIFDDVPPDGSGASLLLPAAELRNLLRASTAVPPSVRRRLLSLFGAELRRDSFDELFDLMHGKHPWREALAAELAARQLVLRLERGEGYLCDDRRWLHGRLPVTGSIRSFRFHRLVF
jgi:hypothetical protein